MTNKDRRGKRKRNIVAHWADGYSDAEDWDLEFWQCQTPQQRLSALVAIRENIAKVKGKRR